MSNQNKENINEPQKEFLHLQKPGWRIIKTCLAVFLCLLFSLLRNDTEGHAFHACFAAIIAIKSNLQNSWLAGLNRLYATAIGAALGLIPLQARFYFDIPVRSIGYYALAVAFLFLTIWLTIVVKVPEATALAAIIFLWTALIEATVMRSALGLAATRFIDTTVGILVALTVNQILPPYSKEKKREDR